MTNRTELLQFLESTLKTLDDAAGDIDEEAHAKLQLLKATLDPQAEAPPLLSEQSISAEIARLEGSLTELEAKLAEADPMTKELLGTSARIFTNSDKAP